jgi:hypothetical protein
MNGDGDNLSILVKDLKEKLSMNPLKEENIY